MSKTNSAIKVAQVLEMHKGVKAHVFYADAQGVIKKDSKPLSLINPKVYELPVKSTQIRKINGTKTLIIGVAAERGRPINSVGRAGRVTKRRMAKATVEVNGNVYERTDADSIAENVLTEEDYDQWLDDVFGDVEVASYKYSTSGTLKEIDPIAYNIGYTDFIDAVAGSVDDELDNADAGDEIYVGKSIKIKVLRKLKKRSYADEQIRKLMEVVMPETRVSEVGSVPRGYEVRLGTGKMSMTANRRTEINNDGTAFVKDVAKAKKRKTP